MKFLLRILPILLFAIDTLPSQAQTDKWEATRCGSVDRIKPIRNISVDAKNNKYVSNSRTVYQVQACDLSSPLNLAPGEHTVLEFRGGNVDQRWLDADFKALVTDPVEILSSWYNESADLLLLGTRENGVYFFKTKPQLKLVDNLTTANSKLKSNRINIIFQDPSGRYWIGSEEGMLNGTPSKWRFDLNGYGVQRVRAYGQDVYTLADGELWVVEGGDKWRAINIDEDAQEGELKDFDIDKNGKLWLLSAVATQYDWIDDQFTVFGPIQNYTSEFGNCIAADAFGEIWVGTNDKGLYYIGPGSKMAVVCLLDKKPGCAANDAALKVKVSGGEAPFTYAWSVAALTGDNPQGLSPGTYSVTVTDGKGLSKTAEVEVPDPRITLTGKALKNESSAGAADGSAEVKVLGGSPRYTYTWDNGEKSDTALKLKEGQHTVTVSDQNGCTAVAKVTITQNIEALSLSIEEKSPIKCAGGKEGQIAAQVNGGKMPFTYQWSHAGGKESGLNGLSSGVYTITVTDGRGIQATASYTLGEPAPLSAVALPQAPASTGNADGQATVKVQGGTPPYSYSWSNGERDQLATKLATGPNSVSVTDANGCSISAKLQITENILPLAVQLTLSQPIRCSDRDKAALQVDVSGGKGPFSFAWNNPAAQGEAPKNLDAGKYLLTVTDGKGTTATATISIAAPAVLSLNANVTAPASTGNSDGKASLKAEGGVSPYNYAWDNGESESKASKLAPGAHQATVTDANGCTATASVAITETILPLEVRIGIVREIKCGGIDKAELLAEVSGGKAPYQLQWSDPNLNGEHPSNVPPGQYAITVTDAKGATINGKVDVSEPEALKVKNITGTSASTGNYDGSAIAEVQGGKKPYAYNWDNGDAKSTAAKLAPGMHQLTVTDANGCTATASVQITENILPLELQLEISNTIACNGQAQGALAAKVKGGKGPYTYLWSNPALKGEQLTQLKAGLYALTLTDATGATQTASIQLAEPQALKVELEHQVGASTERTKDGKASVKISGGAEPYKIAWDNGETSVNNKQLTIGAHTVTVTDANGCSVTTDVAVAKRIMPDLTPGMLSDGQTLRIERLQFEADSARLTPDCLPVLDEVYEFLLENGKVVIEIGGHTNSTPPDAFCDRLSTARAKSVADYLVSKGIDPKRVVYKGYGKRNPIATNTTPEGRRLNQRVEIKILRLN